MRGRVGSALLCLVLASSLAAGTAYADAPHAVGAVGASAGASVDASASADRASSSTQLQVQSLSTQAKKAGWVSTSAGTSYYRKGEKVTGLQKIGSSYYYFSSGGVMRTSDVTVGGAVFYVEGDGKVFGAKRGSTYYYRTLQPMTSADAFDFDTYLWARRIVASITGAGDSNSTKLWKAFVWVKGKSYGIHQNFSPYQTNWPAIYARYHFADQGGDCHSDGAAFAYLAAAIGYAADVCIDSWGTGYAPSHCWAMIGSAVYDPLFYESKSTMYYGATSGTYETSPTARFRVPQYKASNNSSASVSKALLSAGSMGLKKTGGKIYYYLNGVKLRNTWKTVDGKRYYFKANGAAATLSTKVGGAYYVFGKDGVLKSSKKAGTRIVKIGSKSYQVTKAGKAAAGWSANKKRYFGKTGLMASKAWKTIGGKRYYFAKNGVRTTGSSKVGGTYYVFDAAGALQRGTSSTGSLVAVGAKTYRVDRAGRAVKGWSADGAQRFGKTGLLLTGVWYLNGGFYAADKAGAYLAEKTAALNAAAKTGAKATALRRLLGEPESELYAASCNFAGDDGLWTYRRFVVTTARPTGAPTIEEALAAEDAAADAADDAAAETAADDAGTAADADAADDAKEPGESNDDEPFERIYSIKAR